MNIKSVISILLGEIAGISCLYLLLKYGSALGYIGGFVVLLILILSPLMSLIVDFYINRKSTFLGRFIICLTTFLILIGFNYGNRMENIHLELTWVIGMIILGSLISLLLSKFLKY